MTNPYVSAAAGAAAARLAEDEEKMLAKAKAKSPEAYEAALQEIEQEYENNLAEAAQAIIAFFGFNFAAGVIAILCTIYSDRTAVPDYNGKNDSSERTVRAVNGEGETEAQPFSLSNESSEENYTP